MNVQVPVVEMFIAKRGGVWDTSPEETLMYGILPMSLARGGEILSIRKTERRQKGCRSRLAEDTRWDRLGLTQGAKISEGQALDYDIPRGVI